jgi:hypothetical protein
LHIPAAASPIIASVFDLPKIGRQYFGLPTTDGKTNHDASSPENSALRIPDPSSMTNVLAPLVFQKSDHILN